MRTILILGVIAFAAFTAGWFKINREGDSTTIEINRAEIRSDARRAIDRGREILDNREAALSDRQDDRPFADDSQYVDQSGYAEDRFQDDRYNQQRYADQQFRDDQRYQSDQRYQEDRRYDNSYQARRPSEDRYVDDRYSDDRYSDDRYARPIQSGRYDDGTRR